MTIGPWVLTDSFRAKLATDGVRPGTASWKVGLFLSTSDLSVASTTYAGVTNQHANANGYLTGGVTVTLTVTGTTTVTIALTAPAEWTASGGAITAKWAALYEVGDDIAALCLLDATGIDVTATPGQTLEVDSPNICEIT